MSADLEEKTAFKAYPSQDGIMPIDGILELYHSDGSKSRHRIIDGKPDFNESKST